MNTDPVKFLDHCRKTVTFLDPQMSDIGNPRPPFAVSRKNARRRDHVRNIPHIKSHVSFYQILICGYFHPGFPVCNPASEFFQYVEQADIPLRAFPGDPTYANRSFGQGGSQKKV